jgi:hypothetical protein
MQEQLSYEKRLEIASRLCEALRFTPTKIIRSERRCLKRLRLVMQGTGVAKVRRALYKDHWMIVRS